MTTREDEGFLGAVERYFERGARPGTVLSGGITLPGLVLPMGGFQEEVLPAALAADSGAEAAA